MSVEDWYLIKSPNRFSGFEQDQFIRHAIESFNEILSISPEAYDIKINGVDKRALIQFLSNTGVTTSNLRKIVTHIGELSIGDYVDHKNSIWLVISLPDDDRMSQDAIMEICTNTIKWNDSNGIMKQYPCTVSRARPFGVLMDKQTNINVPEGQVYVTVQYNTDTLNIKHKQRFVLGTQSYEVMGMDDVNLFSNGKGCIVFTMKLVEKSVNDDTSSGISDNSGGLKGSDFNWQ